MKKIQKKKTFKKSKVTFVNIPLRVVVYNIFSYIEKFYDVKDIFELKVIVIKGNKNTLQLTKEAIRNFFFYFKMDKFRKIFSCLHGYYFNMDQITNTGIGIKGEEKSVVPYGLKLSKTLATLKAIISGYDDAKKVIFEITKAEEKTLLCTTNVQKFPPSKEKNMLIDDTLKVLKVLNYRSDRTTYDADMYSVADYVMELFPRHQFLKLEILFLDVENLTDENKWKEMPMLTHLILYRGLQTLHYLDEFHPLIPDFYFSNFFLSDTFFIQNKWLKNLTSLKIIKGDFVTGVGWVLPNLKAIEFYDLANLNDSFFINNTFQNLELLYLSGSPSRRRIRFDDIFAEADFSRCSLLTGRNWNRMDNLRNIFFYFHHIRDDFFERNIFEKLESIHFNSCNFISGNNWKPMKNLKKIDIVSCKKFGNDFFKINKFEKLEKMLFSNCELLNGKNWNPMKNLKEIEFSNCKNLGDDFFETNKFDKLEKIQFYICKLLRGINWKPVNNLKEIDISGCDNFGNVFFETNKFENFEVLKLEGNQILTGRNWNFMNNLKEIDVAFCKNFGNDFFKKNKFEKLEKIVIRSFRLLDGKNWNPMSNLKEIEFSKCGRLGDDFFRKHDFNNLEVLEISDCYNFEFVRWKSIGKNLSKLLVYFDDEPSDEIFFPFLEESFKKLKDLTMDGVTFLFIDKWNLNKLFTLELLEDIEIRTRYLFIGPLNTEKEIKGMKKTGSFYALNKFKEEIKNMEKTVWEERNRAFRKNKKLSKFLKEGGKKDEK
jgi:hypothetical protein